MRCSSFSFRALGAEGFKFAGSREGQQLASCAKPVPVTNAVISARILSSHAHYSYFSQRALSTHMGNTYPNHKGNDYCRNHTLYHIGTLDPLRLSRLKRGCCICRGPEMDTNIR